MFGGCMLEINSGSINLGSKISEDLYLWFEVYHEENLQKWFDLLQRGI